MTTHGTGGSAAAKHATFRCIRCLKSYWGTLDLAECSVCLVCRAKESQVNTRYCMEHKYSGPSNEACPECVERSARALHDAFHPQKVKVFDYCATHLCRYPAAENCPHCVEDVNRFSGVVITPATKPTSFVKDDAGKPPLEMLALIDDGFAVEVAKAIEWGGNHYGFDNWKKEGMTWRRYLGAPIRHIFKFIRGEKYDKVTGIHHLAHAVVSLMFVFVAERDGLGTDDRFPIP